MFASFDEAAAYIRENQIRMVDLKFSDLWGRWRHLTIPASQFTPQLMTDGVGFDGSSVGLKSVKAGDMVDLASGRSEPLKQSPDAPLVKDLGADFPSDGYFMFVAPAGLPDDARRAISDAISEIVTDPSTKANGFLKKAFGGATIIKGGDLDQYLAKELERSKVLLKAASE